MEKEKINHYQVLGLISAEIEATKLSQRDITKAFRLKALQLHPDKHPDDPNAKANFQQLNSSYQILSDETSRKLYDLQLFRTHQERRRVHIRRRPVPGNQGGVHNHAPRPFSGNQEGVHNHVPRPSFVPRPFSENQGSSSLANLFLKVSWDVSGGRCDYTVEKLRNLFAPFGQVESACRLMKQPTQTRMTAIVSIRVASKDAAFRAIRESTLGDSSNPLRVELQSSFR